uniref:Uncharacterized protein n=1 Tax=Panagrolaimus davidi TaxID=227884 RepID=A0A914PPQ9_9BILA
MSLSRNLIIHVHNKVLIDSYNIKTNKYNRYKEQLNFHENDTKLFQQLQFIFNLKEVKAIAFSSVGFELPTYNKFYQFRLKCREFCEKNHIFCLIPAGHLSASVALSHTQTMVQKGEKVMIFFLFGTRPVAVEYIRTTTSYQYIKHCTSKYPSFTQKWEKEMFDGLKPKKIILSKDPITSDLEKAQKYFESYSPVVFDFECTLENCMDPIVNKVLHLMGEKVDPYDIEVPCMGKFDVRMKQYSLFKVEPFDSVPCEKSAVIAVNQKKRVSMYASYPSFNPPELVKEIELSTFKKNKKVKVTLKLDINSFYEFYVEPFNGKNEKESKENVDDFASPGKAQMVFEKQHFSVSYFANNKQYNFNDSDGQIKTPTYISFHEKKPTVGKSAMEIYETKPKVVIFDLVKLCSISTDDVFNPKWGFKLIKVENGSLNLEFESSKGKTQSSLDILLALVLKNGRNRIEKETGKRMKEIEVEFDGFFPNETLKKNFVEAGKLLKINIVFV